MSFLRDSVKDVGGAMEILTDTLPSRDTTLGNLTQRIVQDLGSAIITGEFTSDTPFPNEADICKRYGASRSIVREAVKVLNAKGLVTARPRRGTQVRPDNEWNLMDPDVLSWLLKRRFNLPLLIDFTRTRLAIEPMAAQEAARTGTQSQLDVIEQAMRGLREARMGADDPLNADIRFHLSLLEASNNRFFFHMRPMVEAALRFAVRFDRLEGAGVERDLQVHDEVTQAILRRDGAGASAAIKGLLEQNLHVMLKALEEVSASDVKATA
ncbi:FadR/GntR family transcriptional regulator [Parvularcula sp. LCG005]|uniref:FadR/GntR family transcriptional regulator n=1 Tax=Parvularcula sp. LCG005 TaxID=3078805 RepID=UPI002942DDC5|nr:FadR/GntR family transcriptional regulator [Parvularcula sp. LCG005]WOI54567.1 FadR/GntR family transcriptional regulator [Parvularcula sp. LCG005]